MYRINEKMNEILKHRVDNSANTMESGDHFKNGERIKNFYITTIMI
jgi:hypothetical protein